MQETTYQYDKDDLDKIASSVNLLEYASHSLDFTRKGDLWWAHCPSTDHNDNTPSLCINTEWNTYKCFACNRHGNIISWLRDFEGLSFQNAVKKAASLANITLGEQKLRSQTMKINKALARPPKKAIERAILDPKIYERYSKEYPREWLDEGISEEAMRRYFIRVDNERNAIVYPVFDADRNFIGIKGRTRWAAYKELNIPKYMNYYKIGTVDFFQGWHQAIQSAKEKNEIIIFEGIKSCMKAYDYGYYNTVSAEKHDISEGQLKLLIKLGVNVVIAFDSDVNLRDRAIMDELMMMRRFLNVYIIDDKEMLGGADAKNSPVDLGKEIWEKLYEGKYKI